MSLTNLLVVALTVAAAARGDGNNVVFEDSLPNTATTAPVDKPTTVVPDRRPTTPTPSRPDKIVQVRLVPAYERSS